MHSQIAGKSTPRYVSNVGTLLGSSSLPAQCRKRRLGQSLSGLGGSVVFRACIGQASFGGGLGNRPIRRAVAAACSPPIADAFGSDRFRSAFVA